MARLFRFKKNYVKAIEHYTDAYKRIAGGFTDSDFVYYYANYAGVYESMEDYETSLSYWITCSLCWLVMQVPYSLSWRPAKLLSGNNINVFKDVTSIACIDKFLSGKIEDLYEKIYKKKLQVSFKGGFNFISSKEILNKKVKSIKIYRRNNMLLGIDDKFDNTSDNNIHGKLRLIVSTAVEEVLKMPLDSKSTIVVFNSSHHSLDVMDKRESDYDDIYLATKNYCGTNIVTCDAKKVFIGCNPLISDITYSKDETVVSFERNFLNKKTIERVEFLIIKKISEEKRVALNELLDAYNPYYVYNLIDNSVLCCYST